MAAAGGSWFAELFGFEEGSYEEARAGFALEQDEDGKEVLLAVANGRRFSPGRFERPSLAELRAKCEAIPPAAGADADALQVRNVFGDVREMHTHPAAAGAVFQVASQFNCLEFVDASRTPEDGVRIYEFDRTQGPACALACAASTVWRNYFLPVDDDGERGQRAARQVNNLEDVQAFLGSGFVEVRNGYTFCSDVEALAARVDAMDDEERDTLRSKLRVGVQWDAEVTDQRMEYKKTPEGKWANVGSPCAPVTQVFCSALALGSSAKLRLWRAFATLILEAAYEATLAAALLNHRRGGPRDAYLTLLGGGNFGNGPKWIEAAIRRALALYKGSGLRVHIVHYSKTAPWVRAYAKLAETWGGGEPPAEGDGADETDEDG